MESVSDILADYFGRVSTKLGDVSDVEYAETVVEAAALLAESRAGTLTVTAALRRAARLLEERLVTSTMEAMEARVAVSENDSVQELSKEVDALLDLNTVDNQ